MSYRSVPRGDLIGSALNIVPGIGGILSGGWGLISGLFGGGPTPEEKAAAAKYLKGAVGFVSSNQTKIQQLASLNSRLRPYGIYWDPVAKTLKRLTTTTKRSSNAVRTGFSRT